MRITSYAPAQEGATGGGGQPDGQPDRLATGLEPTQRLSEVGPENPEEAC